MTDDAGEPIEGIFVTVWTPSPVDGHPEIAGDTETAADGTYSIDGLRSGDYRVQFESDGDYANEYYDNELTIDHATVLDVDTGEVVDGIDAQLVDAAHLTGTVTGVGGELLPLAAVVAYAWHDGHWDDVGIAFADDTDNGDYDLGGLSPGTYRLEFFSFRIEDDEGNPIGINADEYWNDQPTLELAQDIVISEAGEVQDGFDAVLEDGQYPSDVANLTPPAISGSPIVGQTLTTSPGTWNLAATTFHYQWFAGTTPVGADAPTYSPTAADVGKTIKVTVSGLGRRPRQRRRDLGPDSGGDRNRGDAASATGAQEDRQPQAARDQGHSRGGAASASHDRSVEPGRGRPDLPVVRRRQADRQVRPPQAGAQGEVGRQEAQGQGRRQGRRLPDVDGRHPAQHEDQAVTRAPDTEAPKEHS